MPETIKVFVGCAANGEDAESCAVLEYSLREKSSLPVEIVWMHQTRDPASFWHGWNTTRWTTPFSAYRFGIPAFCGYQGRAIYCDSDVWFAADPVELWRQDFAPGKIVMGKGGGSWRLCVSLWDCAAAKDWLPPIETLRNDPAALTNATSILRTNDLIQAFAGDWNCLDGGAYESLADPRIKALHYTKISSQPQLRHALPRLKAAGQSHWFDGTVVAHDRPDVVAEFDRLLAAAIAEGYAVEDYIPAEPFGPYRKVSLANYKGAPA